LRMPRGEQAPCRTEPETLSLRDRRDAARTTRAAPFA